MSDRRVFKTFDYKRVPTAKDLMKLDEDGWQVMSITPAGLPRYRIFCTKMVEREWERDF